MSYKRKVKRKINSKIFFLKKFYKREFLTNIERDKNKESTR